MKTTRLFALLLSLATLTLAAPCYARHSHFHHIMGKFGERREVTRVSFPPSVFSFMLGQDDRELKSFLRKLHHMSIYTCDGADVENMKTEITRSLNENEYKDLIIVNDGKDHIVVKMRTEDGEVREVVVFITDATSLVVMQLEGNIDLKSVVKFARHMQSKGTFMI